MDGTPAIQAIGRSVTRETNGRTLQPRPIPGHLAPAHIKRTRLHNKAISRLSLHPGNGTFDYSHSVIFPLWNFLFNAPW